MFPLEVIDLRYVDKGTFCCPSSLGIVKNICKAANQRWQRLPVVEERWIEIMEDKNH